MLLQPGVTERSEWGDVVWKVCCSQAGPPEGPGEELDSIKSPQRAAETLLDRPDGWLGIDRFAISTKIGPNGTASIWQEILFNCFNRIYYSIK